MRIIKFLIINSVFILTNFTYSEENCIQRICFLDLASKQEIDETGIAFIQSLIKQYENLDVPYESITVKYVMQGPTLLISAQKPDYYGNEFLILKDGVWKILYQSSSIY